MILDFFTLLYFQGCLWVKNKNACLSCFRFDSFSGKGCKRRALVNHGWVRESFVVACRGSVSSAQVLTLKRARWILESSSLQTGRIISSFSLWSPYSQAWENKTKEKNKSTEISLNFQPSLHSPVPWNVCFPEPELIGAWIISLRLM